MTITKGKIVIIDLDKIFINGKQLSNVVSITINKSQSIIVRVSNIDCKLKEELQSLGINIKVI